MDINSIVSVIGSVGFPIFACCYMFVIYQKAQEEHNKSLNDVQTAIQKLELAINSLINKLD